MNIHKMGCQADIYLQGSDGMIDGYALTYKEARIYF